jgi:hypothetical protein
MDTAPKDRPILAIVEGEEVEIEWADQRQCMLAGIGGGNGYFGPGWQDTYNHLVVYGEPTGWREIE